jgi:hypothetical protein
MILLSLICFFVFNRRVLLSLICFFVFNRRILLSLICSFVFNRRILLSLICFYFDNRNLPLLYSIILYWVHIFYFSKQTHLVWYSKEKFKIQAFFITMLLAQLYIRVTFTNMWKTLISPNHFNKSGSFSP